MQRQTISIISCHAKLLALLCMLFVMTFSAHAQKKVIIASDWDFAPFEFLNGEGNADGYNIELLHTILTRMNVPHEFVMKQRRQNIGFFLNREADLIIDYRDRYIGPEFYRSVTPMGYYRVVAARRNNTHQLTYTRQLLNNGTIVFNNVNDSISYLLLGDMANKIDKMEFQSPRTALNGIKEGIYTYFIWGEQPMKWKIREYNISDVTFDYVQDLKPTEIHIVGYDQKLIDEIDSYYARMVQSGEIDQLQDKWFRPEVAQSRTSSIPLYIGMGLLLLTAIVFFTYRFTRNKVKKALAHNDEMEEIMHHALSMGNYAVAIADLQKGHVSNQHGNVLPENGVSIQELKAYIHPDDQSVLFDGNQLRISDKQKATPFTVRWNDGHDGHVHWATITGYSYPEYDNKKKPVSIIIAARDITEQGEKERKDRDMASHYFKMFESTLLGMSFYAKDGHLLDVNDKMKEVCDIDEEKMEYFQQLNLFESDYVKGIYDPNSHEILHVCQHMYYPQMGLDKFIELRIVPAEVENGEIGYFIVTARDITEERSMYLELRSQSRALEEAEKSNRAYENELRTLLVNSDMYVWKLDFSTRIISFSRSLNKVDFTRTLDEHLKSISAEERQKAYDSLPGLRHLKGSFNVVHRFLTTPINDSPCWYATSGMPVTNSKGEVTGLFGIVRNINSLMEAQEKLKEETARAENSAMLKATFLANMTHEIRTPLNAIVGFSDILQMVNSTEERKEFIRIIHNNCDMLMRLINDIFEASTMDIKPLEIVPHEVDFAAEFNIISQSLSQRVQEPGVEYIVDSPQSSFHTVLDMGRMQQVITNFVTNAVKYTHQGHIRVGWEYKDSGIYIFCEDTGAGIPKEKQKKVFDRFVKLNDFVQGTGLGLSICKNIAERSGGKIGVNSEGLGHGSTFWIWVPCQELKIENRTDADQ